MNQERIIKLAREAGICPDSDSFRPWPEQLAGWEKLAALIEAEVRGDGAITDEGTKQEPVAYINVTERRLEWANQMKWETSTVATYERIPLYTQKPPSVSESNTHQPAAVAQLVEAEPIYAFRRKGQDDFCTCNKKRYDELSLKENFFEVAIFYRAGQ